MASRAGSFFLILVLLFLAYVVLQSALFPYAEDKLVPILAGGLAFVLGGIELARQIMTSGRTQQGSEIAATGPEDRRVALALGWTAGLCAGLLLFGFVVGGAVFILSYLKLHGAGWRRAITITVVTTTAIYGIFQVLLKVQLYPGAAFSWL